MKILLNNIENSENNNPLLTAALAEIDRLNNQLALIKSTVESAEVKQSTDYGQFKILSGQDELQAKLDFIYEVLNPAT